MSQTVRLTIGTRGSPLALAQTHAVRNLLCKAHGLGTDEIVIKIIKTTGDTVQNRKLADIGGKGLFTKEIENALSAKEIDLAVHSAKDMLTVLPDGLAIAACLKREDARDVFICHKAKTLEALAAGATLGTASPRREAQVRRLRPDIKVQLLRGNVETRLRKVRDGEIDATILAMAGLRRLGLVDQVTHILPTKSFLPAVGQGVVAVEAREDDVRTCELLAALNNRDAQNALLAERAFLAVLEGSCRSPIAGHAEIEGAQLRFRGLVMRPDGSESYETVRTADVSGAASVGAAAGHEIKAKAPPDFFS
jgi:hydroxymethylbilane synthase